MENSLLLRTFLKSALPAIRKIVDSGKVDSLIQSMKSRYKPGLPEGESVEILITTEEDGNEYVNIVTLDEGQRIKAVLSQSRLSEIITELFNHSEI